MNGSAVFLIFNVAAMLWLAAIGPIWLFLLLVPVTASMFVFETRPHDHQLLQSIARVWERIIFGR